MRNAIVTVALFALLGPAQAAELEDARANLVAGIERVEQVFIPQCKQKVNPKVCAAAYKMANARNRATLAEIDFWLAASTTTGSLREELAELVPLEEYNRDNRVTMQRSSKMDQIFFGIKPSAALRN